MATRNIRRLLIANRGEIAVRIARCARTLGIGTVAVASDADLAAHHVRQADRVVAIGPPPAAQSYLRGDALIAAARETSCDAIHPGYGFLSQNGAFADAVAAAGLIFVGPPGDAMRLMGDKTSARRAMEAAGVPVVPGFQGDGAEPPAVLRREALRIGFPLLVKAAAGGGGRGMRIVENEAGLDAAIEGASREAEKAFGDGRLFLERFLPAAHHVEIQVLADAHGNAVHLLERECSVQRRYQKLIEEAPSPLLDAKLRAAMGQAAVRAALACGYVGAGTVEFLATEAGEFFFLEMNTRLQVEHPVTEAVTGLDLVKLQLEVAAGSPLPFAQEAVTARGHAIECRINAEDPAADFAPSSGRLLAVDWPRGPGVRVDEGYVAGDEISTHYDSLIAKIIVHAATREDAIARMRNALRETAVLGVATNAEFLAAVLDHEKFRAGRATTTFVRDEMGSFAPRDPSPSVDESIAIALFDALPRTAAGSSQGAVRPDPWSVADGFRPGV
jgi:3-methylcrotonyl-CoA carboxylase alpha subunit